MGTNLIIKNADFSQNAIESIVPSDLLYSFSGSVNGITIDTGLHLLTSVTKWTMFVKWSNISCIDENSWVGWLSTQGDSRIEVCGYNSKSKNYYTVYRKSNYYTIDGVSYIEPVGNTGKIGLRRNGYLGQITFDGIIWKNTNIVLPIEEERTLKIKSPKIIGTAEVKIFNSATKDISQLF